MGEQRPKILVADDVPENVRLLEAVLVPRGYEVVTATDGRAALDLVETEQPDLILLDVMMPGLDGYAVCRSLRANNDTAMLPVIMVTSSIGQEKTKAIEAGAEDVVTNDDGSIEVVTAPHDFMAVRTGLEKQGFKAALAEVTFKPTTETVMKGDEAARMQKLIDALENIDDVQEVYTTAVMES